MTQQIFEINPWKVTTKQLDKENRRLQESLTSLGNGYMGMRGNFEEAYSGDHHQGTYLAGVWYPDKTRVGWWKNGYPEYFGKVINAMNFLYMHIFVDGEEIDLYTDEVKDFDLTLDMEKGRLERFFTVVKNSKEITVHFTRFLSIDIKELCAIKVEVTASEKAAIRIESALDGNVQNEDANYDEMFWEWVEQTDDTLQSKRQQQQRIVRLPSVRRGSRKRPSPFIREIRDADDEPRSCEGPAGSNCRRNLRHQSSWPKFRRIGSKTSESVD